MRGVLARIAFFLSRAIMWHVLSSFRLIVRRDRRLVLFGSWKGERYAGNSKVLFEYVVRYGGNINTVWITGSRDIFMRLDNMGMPVCMKNSIKGVYYCLKAGVYIYDCKSSDINSFLSRGAIKYNLWHGTPLKKIERDIDNKKHVVPIACSRTLKGLGFRMLRPEWCENHDYILSTGPEVSRRFMSAFDIDRNKIKEFGYPVYDNRDRVSRPEEFKGYGRILLYAPTFRDNRAEDPKISWLDLNEVMKSHNALFVCKFHPSSRLQDAIPDNLENIVTLHEGSDIYDYLWHSDILITDYSSVFYDFLLMERPIVFYSYDLLDYAGGCRGFYVDYEKEVPEKPVLNFDDLIVCLGRLLGTMDDWRPGRRMLDLKKRIHLHTDHRSCGRVLDHLNHICGC